MNYLEKLEQYNHNIVMENKRLAQEYKSIVSEAAGVPLDRKSDKYQGVSKIGNKVENSDDLTPDDNLNIKECHKVDVPDPNLTSYPDRLTEGEDDEVDVEEPLDTDVSVVDDDVPCEDDECEEVIPIPEDIKQQIIDLGVDTMESDCRFSIHFEDENDENFQKVIEILATAGVSGAVAVTDFGTYIAVAKECPEDTDDVDDDDTVDDDTVEVDDDTVEVNDDDSIDIVDEEMSPELKTKLINTAAGTAVGATAGAAGGYFSTKDPEKRKKRAMYGAVGGGVAGGAAGYFAGDKIRSKVGSVVDKFKKDKKNPTEEEPVEVTEDEQPGGFMSKLKDPRVVRTAAGAAIGAGVGGAAGYLSTKDPEKRRKRAAMGALAGAGVGGYAGYKTAGSQSATPPPAGAPATTANEPPVEVVDDPDPETPVEVVDTPMEPGSARDKMYADMARQHRRRNGVREGLGKALVGGAIPDKPRRSRRRNDDEKELQEGIDWAGLGGSVINYAKEHPVTAAAIGGAAIGALSDKEDRLGGAVKGAALGGGAMALGGYLNGKLNGAPAPTSAGAEAATAPAPTPAADAGAPATVVDDVFDPVSDPAPSTNESIRIREARARRRIRENTLQTRDEFFDSNRVKPLPESIQNMLRTNKKLFTGNK